MQKMKMCGFYRKTGEYQEKPYDNTYISVSVSTADEVFISQYKYKTSQLLTAYKLSDFSHLSEYLHRQLFKDVEINTYLNKYNKTESEIPRFPTEK